MKFTENECEQGLLGDESKPNEVLPKPVRSWQVSNLLLSVVLNIVLVLLLLWLIRGRALAMPKLPTDFRKLTVTGCGSMAILTLTESIPAQMQHLKPSIFDDKLLYNSTTRRFWRDLNPSLPQYFGPPSHKLDAAWAELLQGEVIGISDAEAKSKPGFDFDETDRHETSGHFFVAIDVMHSLHCLNAVRKELDKEYYSENASILRAAGGHSHNLFSGEAQRIHIDHCLNHIRQSLQCHPDLSAAAMKKQSMPNGESFYLGNAQKHTCQDWDAVKTWLDERRASSFGAWGE